MKKYFSGLVGGGKAYFILERFLDLKKGTFLVLVKEDEYNFWKNNLAALSSIITNPPVHLFQTQDDFGKINTLNALQQNPSGIILTTPDSILEKTFSPDNFRKKIIELQNDGVYNFDKLAGNIVDLGYVHVDFVEEKGHLSRRGEIIDVWSTDQPLPWRFVFNNDSLESIRTFDVATQRSQEFIEKARILPVSESKQVYLTDYLPDDMAVYFDFPVDLEKESSRIKDILDRYDWIVNDAFNITASDAGFRSLSKYEGRIKIFLDDLKKFKDQGYKITVFSSHQGEKERLEEILSENRWHGSFPQVLIGPLEESFYLKEKKECFFSSQEVLYRKRPVSFPKFKTGRRLEGLWEISSGDYVVHEKYGIGRYLGLKRIARGDQESEYICIEYKGGDKLYVPVEDFRVVQKYIGLEGYRPKLYSLDTASWEKAKHRAKKSAKELAEELLKLYTERQKAPGIAYPKELPWENELKDSFPYSETNDQLKAIHDVENDLCSPRPMERLICGDVGYGKTEVAIRAAFKVVLASKQVAVLVPTTVLTEQHFQTFVQRLSPFPVKIAALSRFQSKKEQTEVIKGLKSGSIDIVIGTHRLLQKDIEFKNMGLLIIDEEHRFGVKQKEKIKKLKKNVDILLLSATPIPRTLSLALSNIRDLSIIETPPYGRLPIETHMGVYDENVVKKIIQAEISRGGQVFYVHNRVETILTRAQYLKKLVPDIRLGVVHGQLSANEIEETMWNFLHKKIDLLLATTIIESGLDIPTVNTMIIEEAENFGLSQLYQLRGRIGRADKKAYCYLFSEMKGLSEDAQKRLKALKELNELGSGFRLALRDLEIRGGGNILGAQQHGFVREVGFELYSRLIAEASNKLKGIKDTTTDKEEFRTIMDFLIPAYIPSDYIESEDLRILFYRHLTDAKSSKDLGNIKDELLDRFGTMPLPLENLFKLADLRLVAQSRGIKALIEKEKYIEIHFLSAINITSGNILKLAESYKDIMEFIRGEIQGVRFIKQKMAPDAFVFLKNFLSDLNKYAKISKV
ncbi:MAG: transcription-repair coupling factor [Endomicrobiales bacterium]|nr:transcription-repair coupling factor [Endomicrobiales bacterium]